MEHFETMSRLVPSVRKPVGVGRSDIAALFPDEELLWYGRPDVPFTVSIRQDFGTIGLVLAISFGSSFILLLLGARDIATLATIALFLPLFTLGVFIFSAIQMHRRRYVITSGHFIILENVFRPKAYCYRARSATQVWMMPKMPANIYFTWTRIRSMKGPSINVQVGFTELEDAEPIYQLMKRVHGGG